MASYHDKSRRGMYRIFHQDSLLVGDSLLAVAGMDSTKKRHRPWQHNLKVLESAQLFLTESEWNIIPKVPTFRLGLGRWLGKGLGGGQNLRKPSRDFHERCL